MIGTIFAAQSIIILKMKNIQTIVLTLFVLFATTAVSAQQKGSGTPATDNRMESLENKPDSNSKFNKDKIFVGGNFGGNLSGTNTFVDISPIIGYRVTDKIMVGVGATGQFFKRDSFTNRVFGGKVFARYDIIKNLFLHTEYERLVSKRSGDAGSYQFQGLLTGAGYQQRLGPGYFSAMILYNWLDNASNPGTSFNPYSNGIFGENPIVRIGWGVSLGGFSAGSNGVGSGIRF